MSIQAVLKSQYRASLAMLLGAIEACPDDLWTSDRYVNPFWHVAYHTLFFTHLYLQPTEADFVPWSHQRPGYHRLGPAAAAAGPLTPYTADEVRAYWRECQAMVDAAVDRLDLAAPESGFSWYPISKLEHQLVSIRHIQHHSGQLSDRLRQSIGHGVAWVGGAPSQ